MLSLPKINRRLWLALQAQKHRRARKHRLLPAPVLRAAYPTLLRWDWDLPNPFKWNVWLSWDNGASWVFVEDYWHYGDSRQFAPDGGHELYFIVGVDAAGNEITGRSNIVRPDDAPAPDTLLDGLHEFYRPEEGQVFARSVGETDAFDGDPFAGSVAPTVDVNGVYADVEPSFRVVPFREVGGVRRYSGIVWSASPGYIAAGGVAWPAWGTMSNWPTGFLLVWCESPDGEISREVSAATMAAGWVDDGTGWTVGLPFSYALPPTVSKTLFRRPGEGAVAGGTPATITSPLGGLAFDLSNGDMLARQMADDPISRSMDITIAYWVCPAYTGHTSMWLGGSWTWQLIGEQFDRYQWQTTPPPDVNFIGVEGLDDTMANCQYGDWFLVVQRGNTVADTLTQDVYRLRDGHHQRVVATLSACSINPLTAAPANYFADGLMRVMAFGCGFWWGNAGASQVDRCATWSRPLTDTEVLNLFNSGLGWEPA